MAVITWIQAHWLDLSGIYGLTVLLIGAIVKVTPTLKDDTLWLKVIKFLGKVAKFITMVRKVNDDAIRSQTPPTQ